MSYVDMRLVAMDELEDLPFTGGEALRCVRPEYDEVASQATRGSWKGPERLFALIPGGRTSSSDQITTRLILIGPAFIRGKPRYTVQNLTEAYGKIIEHPPVTISNGDGVFQCTVRKPSRQRGKRMRETTIELRGERNSLTYRMVRPGIVDCLANLFRCRVRCTVVWESSPAFLQNMTE